MRQALALTAAAGIFVVCAAAQTTEPKTAEEVYKNIQELKGTPADQLVPAMQFISASLGVECGFCHVQGKMDADDKPEKKTARQMMAMTAMINKESFRGQRQVTCYSCHHGSSHPTNTPPVQESDTATHESHPPVAAGTVPNPDEIVAKYIAAVGADAINKVNSRVEKGSLIVGGNQVPIEIYTKAPNKRISVAHMGTGESITAFDGTAGWLGTPNGARAMSAAESEAAGLDAEFALPLRLKEMFPQLRRGRPEEINGVECQTLTGIRQGHPPVRLYFDEKSGLLVRMVRYTDTPMGRNPTQIDYADYRDVDGVKIPFRWTLARPNGRFTIQIAEAKDNVPIEDSKFVKPAEGK